MFNQKNFGIGVGLGKVTCWNYVVRQSGSDER